MNDTFLPSCCSPLSDHWPFRHAQPTLRLISTRFDPAQLQADDLERCGLAPIQAVAKRQAEFLAGRLCAQQALERLTGTGSLPASAEDRAPQWPVATLGSITHSGGYAAAIVGDSRQWQAIGLDAETLIAEPRALRLSAEILTPPELQRISGKSTAEQARHICLTFSAKESLYKALYPLVHKRFWFHDAELLQVDEQQCFTLKLLIDLHPDWPSGTLVTGQYCQMDSYLLTLIAIPR